MKLTKTLKLSLVSLAVLPTASFAQKYRHGMLDVAQTYDAVYSSYGQQAQMRDAMARSDCDEFFTTNSGVYSCATCGDQVVSQCAPVRAIDTAIINGESRDFLTKEEYEAVGQAIGSVNCTDKRTKKRFTSTGYLVASDVVRVAAHAFYDAVKDPKHPKVKRFNRKVEIVSDCTFALTNRASTQKLIFNFTSKIECADLNGPVRLSNCDWAMAKLSRPAPGKTPLNLLPVPEASALDRVSVVGVGHHLGATVDGHDVEWKYKLIDFGFVMPKTRDSFIRGRNQLVQYTLDTSGMSSGEPIMVQIGKELYVVASHVSEVRFSNATDGKWNDKNHMNYGEIISAEMLAAAKTLAAPREKYRFEMRSKLGKTNKEIEI